LKLKLLLILFVITEYSECQNLGLPLIRNYLSSEYKGYSQNWCAEQDSRGVMYFGNGKGILEYDGKNWRRFFTKKSSTVLSMCKNNNGTIYIGAEGEIGYLKPDSLGKINYCSLDNLVPDSLKNFSYVWQTYANSDYVYFVTSEEILVLNKNNQISAIKPYSSFFTSFLINNKLYVQDTKNGLYVITNNKLYQYKNWSSISDLRAMFYVNNKYIGLSNSKGLITFDENSKPQIVECELNEYKKIKFYKSVKLQDNRLAIATMTGGIILSDINGKILQILNSENGLNCNAVYYLFKDKSDNLWAMLDNGISYIEINYPITIFDKRLGITGIAQDIQRIGNNLFIATTDGLFKFYNESFINNKFKSANFNLYNNVSGQTFSITNFNNNALYCNNGVCCIENNTLKKIYHNNYEICVETSNYNKNIIYYGGNDEFGILKLKNYKIINKNILSLKGDIYYIVEQNKNNLWASTVNNGIYNIKILDTNNLKSLVKHYDTLSGLPSGMLEVKLFKNKIIAGSKSGIFEFDETLNKFNLVKYFSNDTNIINSSTFNIFCEKSGNVWAMLGKTITKFINNNNNYYVSDTLFRRLNFNDLYFIYPDIDSNVWLGSTEGIYKYNLNNNSILKIKPTALITKVIYKNDTLFYGCYNNKNIISLIQPNWSVKELKYYHNSFLFEFTSTSYYKEENNLFSYYLEGYDDNWSDYSLENKKEYTNLPEGNYKFHLKTKNIFNIESIEEIYEFNILSPWYRTIWAYLLFFVIFVFIIFLFIKIYTRRLKNANIKLEKIVAIRTDELRHRNQEILQQKEEISAQRDEIEAQRDLVTNQKNKIEEIHETLTSSIRYAMQIQTAALPDKEILSKLLKDYFVIYKPRDIVSGDFYWINKQSDNLIICVADCTGHGVPGAFMSMLGISLLNEIVSKEKITNPSEILNLLRTNIINSLKQENNLLAENKIKDGMDISLLVVNVNTLECQWAGANNPIYILKPTNALNSNPEKNEPELIELKPDKMPIAIYPNMKDFSLINFKLNSNEVIYLFSDGFADQFGGSENKKYKYSSLKKLFIKVNNLSMEEQKNEIENEFENWHKNQNQIDDVTILGIKF